MIPDRRPSSGQPSRHPFAILGGALLTLALLHHAIFYAPARERILHLREQIQTAQWEARKRDTRRTRIPDFERQLAQARRVLEERMARLAQVRDHPFLLDVVSKTARAAGLRIARFRTGEEKEQKTHAVIPLELSLDGNFYDLIRFLRTLVKLPLAARLGNLTLLSQDTARNRAPLSISLQILTYRLPPAWLEQRVPSPAGNPDRPREGVFPSRAGTPATTDELPERMRNPFLPAETPSCQVPANALEGYDLRELKLVGIFWEPHEPKGLVMDGTESGHIIVPGSRIGNRGGIVKAITPTDVVVEENPNGATNAPRSVRLPLPDFTSRRSDSPGRKTGKAGERVRRGEDDRGTSTVVLGLCSPTLPGALRETTEWQPGRPPAGGL